MNLEKIVETLSICMLSSEKFGNIREISTIYLDEKCSKLSKFEEKI